MNLSIVTLDTLNSTFIDLLTAIEEAIHANIEDQSFAQRAFKFFGHFDLHGGYETFIKRFEFAPRDALAPVELSGVSFAVSEPPLGVTNATVILEKSVRASNSLFLNASCLIDAAEHDLTASSQHFRTHVTDAMRISDLLAG